MNMNIDDVILASSVTTPPEEPFQSGGRNNIVKFERPASNFGRIADQYNDLTRLESQVYREALEGAAKGYQQDIIDIADSPLESLDSYDPKDCKENFQQFNLFKKVILILLRSLDNGEDVHFKKEKLSKILDNLDRRIDDLTGYCSTNGSLARYEIGQLEKQKRENQSVRKKFLGENYKLERQAETIRNVAGDVIDLAGWLTGPARHVGGAAINFVIRNMAKP